MGNNTKPPKKHKIKAASILFLLIVAVLLASCAKGPADNPVDTTTADAPQTQTQATTTAPPEKPTTVDEGETTDSSLSPAQSGLVIPVKEVSEKATFYPVEIDGTKLEVIAVKAPDGSIRTAFNTCQVCYDSGRGYYKQEGNTLVCQNCGNKFRMDQVQVLSGGCNPVPIMPEDKTQDATNITISEEYLAKSKAIFANWKTDY
jgi:hypothetical protein